MNVSIRSAFAHDREQIRVLYLAAFPDAENQLVASLAETLLTEETTPPTLSFVAGLAGEVVGHIAFSPVTSETESNWHGYLLAPLAVSPEHQRGGIGSQLIRYGIERFLQQGVGHLLVYGDPAYYGRFGFQAETATNFLPPYELTYPFGWQAMRLNKNAPRDQPPIRLTCASALHNPALW